MKNFVSYREVKENVSMEMVLTHFNLLAGLKLSKDGLRGCCPVHGGKHPNQFFVDLQKNCWNCFGGCKMGENGVEGNVIGFTAGLKKISFREAALYLAETFGLNTEQPTATPKAGTVKKEKTKKQPPTTESQEPENQPLTFELKNLDNEHAFFEEKGIISDTVEHFGLGFCQKGMMKGRIVFPVHNHKGELIGYTGRTVEEITPENPKWLLPPIIKSKVVYNLHRVVGNFDTVIIVEGTMDLIALHQSGFPNTISVLGKEVLADTSLSYDQARLISARFSKVVLMLDGDQEGREGTEKSLKRLAPHLFVRALTLPEGKDPWDLTQTELLNLLSFLRG